MNLREEILKEHSKANSLRIVDWVGNNPKRFAELLHLFLHDEYRVGQRAAWTISTIAERHPDLVKRHLPAMVKRMETPNLPTAIRRNVLRILQFLPIPEDLHGQLMNICFQLLEDPKEPIAIRAFTMTVLCRLAHIYPDIKGELRMIIEDMLSQNPSPGIRSRSAKVLASLK